jgi:uridine phosphorylase
VSDTERYGNAEVVKTEEGKQYHVGVKPGDIAPFIMLVGDPARAEKVATHFSKIHVKRQNREYVTITGIYDGEPLTVTATGIGTDNTEIAVIELTQCVENPTFIRVGSSGALQDGMSLGDLVVSTGAVKLESTSNYFVLEGYPAVAHHEVVLALIEAAAKTGAKHHVGLTATACGFYGAQSRNVPGFPVRDPEMPAKLMRMGVKNFEMEASLLFTLAQLRGIRAGAVCAIYANRRENEFVDTNLKERAEASCIATGLEAVKVLRRMDKKRGQDALWRPSLGL